MTPGGAWLADLVEHALSEHLTDEGSEHSLASSGLYHYKQTLSNLRIIPHSRLLGTKNVKAEVGDLRHTVRATFTKAALDEQAVTVSGVSFDKIDVGATFEIRACEIRLSDCFAPARVDLRITSVAVINPGVGSRQFPKPLKNLELEPAIALQLKEYSLRRAIPGGSDGNPEDIMTSQDEFLTQLQYRSLRAPSPVEFDPMTPVLKDSSYESVQVPGFECRPGPRLDAGKDHTDQPRQQAEAAIQDGASSSAQFVTQRPVLVEKPPSKGKSIPKEMSLQATLVCGQDTLNARDFSTSKVGNVVRDQSGGTVMLAQSSAINQSSWQMRTARARYLPRYIGFRAQDQQDLIRDETSWQPSLAGKQLPGQVPLQLLQKLWEAADTDGEVMAQKSLNEDVSHEELEISHRSPRTLAAATPKVADTTLPQSPAPSSPPLSWESSPPRLAQRPCLLPPDSSPVQANEAEVEKNGSRPHVDAHDSKVYRSHAQQIVEGGSAAVSIVTQATVLDLGSQSDSDARLMETDVSDEGTDADMTSIEQPALIVTTELQTASNDSTDREATSSLDTMQGIQVSRTPAVNSRHLGAANDRRIDRFPEQRHSSAIEHTQAHPPSSQFVPATYFPQMPHKVMQEVRPTAVKAVLASDRLPAIPPFSTGSRRPEMEEVMKKRRRDCLTDEMSSKRQKLETPRSKIVLTAKDPDFRASELVARQARDEFMAADRRRKEEDVQEREKRAQDQIERHDRDLQDLQERTRLEAPARENEKLLKEREELETRREQDEVERQSQELKELQEKRKREDMAQESDSQEQARLDLERQEKARQERLTGDQSIRVASPSNDDLSIGSRDRPISSGSSIMKHRASTPITGASDYQVSCVSKDHRTTRDSSLADAQDLFELYRITYPAYRGGRTQFEQACRLLGDPKMRAPRAYLNDDFVFRFNNDYQETYYFPLLNQGKLPLPYDQYYRGLEEEDNFEPISVAKVLKPARLAQLQKEESSRGNMLQLGKEESSRGQPHTMTGTVEPRGAQLGAASEVCAIVVDGPCKPKAKLNSVNNSQETSISITDWLQTSSNIHGETLNTHGQASPELGTPPNPEKLADVPNLDLEPEIVVAKSEPPPKATPRRVPWQSAKELPPSSAPARTTFPVILAPGPRPRPPKDKGKGKATAPRRRTDFPLPPRKEESPIDWEKPVVFVKPPSNAFTTVMDRYGKLEKQFAAMDARRGIPRASPQAAVDMSSWKRHPSVDAKGRGKARESVP